mgnify:CR=1 FL=1
MMQMLTTITTGYAYFHPNSGIFGKFMPYHPAIRSVGEISSLLPLRYS